MSERFRLKRDYIVEQLRAAIFNGEYKPGQKLRQEELAARFQLSSTPVREALRELEAQGLVTSMPHQGVYVTHLTVDEIKERYCIKALLESYAAKEAVTYLQNDLPRLQKVLAELRQYQADVREALQAGRKEEVVKLNSEMHLHLYEEARSPLLKQMIIDLWKYRFPFPTLWVVPGRAEQALGEHEQLFDAIERGDAATAEQITREHIDTSSQLLIEYFQSIGEADK